MKKILKATLGILTLSFIVIVLLETFSSYTSSKSIHQNAPVKTKQSINIYAPAEVVYRVFTDINNWPAWQKEIVAAKINGQVQPGNTIDWKTGGLTIHSTLQTVIPNKTIGWSGKAFGSFAIHIWHFEQHDGYTTVTVQESMEGWVISMLSGYCQSHLESATQHWLTALKTQSENVND